MPKSIDYTGETFGRLTVEAFVGNRRVGTQSKRFWRCRCQCGTVIERPTSAFTTGNTSSCGCLLHDSITKHGGYLSAVYKVWHAMIERCRNPGDPSYSDYGGRGIRVCDRWQDFAAFRNDMGPRPARGMLERKEVNSNYEPDNCRWATPLEQANNRRNNRRITYAGETKTMADWAREKGLSKGCLKHRLDSGWNIERALSAPADRGGNGAKSRTLLQIK
jgi:hypothetical protein